MKALKRQVVMRGKQVFIQERVDTLIQQFNHIDKWEDRYKYIIKLGKQLQELPEEYRIDQFKVRGCQSQLWLHAQLTDGNVVFHADSDAAIVRGIVSLLISIYSDSTPDEILQTKPDFLDTIGLRDHLSMSRANGLSSVLKQISLYALALKTQLPNTVN